MEKLTAALSLNDASNEDIPDTEKVDTEPDPSIPAPDTGNAPGTDPCQGDEAAADEEPALDCGGAPVKLFVGGLSTDWGLTAADIRGYFETFGELDEVVLKTQPNGGFRAQRAGATAQRGYAFVSVRDPAVAQAIVSQVMREVHSRSTSRPPNPQNAPWLTVPHLCRATTSRATRSRRPCTPSRTGRAAPEAPVPKRRYPSTARCTTLPARASRSSSAGSATT